MGKRRASRLLCLKLQIRDIRPICPVFFPAIRYSMEPVLADAAALCPGAGFVGAEPAPGSKAPRVDADTRLTFLGTGLAPPGARQF